MINIFPILAIKDNYIWCINSDRYCAVVDPGDARPVISAFEAHNLMLCAILVTHHHHDHTGGINDLLRYTKVPVIGPNKIPLVNFPIKDQQSVEIPKINLSLHCLAIPGHTLEHTAYYSPGFVFTGDTLFTGGCGRVFEGTFEQMYHSLLLLRDLPPDTAIYCGHEYTEKNLSFAIEVEPGNLDLQKRLQETKLLRHENSPTVPSKLHAEKLTNPFLRCDQPTIIQAASDYCGRDLQDPVDVFTVLRQWKDSF